MECVFCVTIITACIRVARDVNPDCLYTDPEGHYSPSPNKVQPPVGARDVTQQMNSRKAYILPP